jgi:DNA-binding IclR family transcriptional regulator
MQSLWGSQAWLKQGDSRNQSVSRTRVASMGPLEGISFDSFSCRETFYFVPYVSPLGPQFQQKGSVAATWSQRLARSRAWPLPSFAISARFIYKTPYVPTKVGRTPFLANLYAFVKKFSGAIKSQRSGGRNRPMLQEGSRFVDTISISATCVHPNPSGWLRKFMKTKAPKISSRYPTPALEKGLDILELFASEESGLTKSDVARKLGRTISEIFRMLSCLEERGYIAQSPNSDRYHLTLHLFRLAQEHPPIKRMIMQALPIMQQVAHELSQSCHLGVLNGGQVVIIAQADSPVSPVFYVKAGAVVDLMHAATGHVILAHQTREARARAIQTWCKRTKSAAPRDLTSHLAAIKERGYEERESYEIEGVINFTYPVLDEHGYAVAALTVPYIRRIGDNTATPVVRQALKRASSQLSQEIGGILRERPKLDT